MNKSKLIYSLIVLVLGIGSVSAATSEGSEQKFNSLDIDGDGFISRSEATADSLLRDRWNDIDKDNDGKLTTQEFEVFAKLPALPFPDN